MYLSTLYLSTKFQPNRTSNDGIQAAILEKQQSAITPELNGWISSKFLSLV
jgi:hypothetical protein